MSAEKNDKEMEKVKTNKKKEEKTVKEKAEKVRKIYGAVRNFGVGTLRKINKKITFLRKKIHIDR